MREAGSLRGRLLRRLAALLAVLLLIGSLSAYFNARDAADTAYDRTLLASARAISAGLYEADGRLKADVPYVALDTFAYDSAGRIFYQVTDIEGNWFPATRTCPARPVGRRAPTTTRPWRATMRATTASTCAW